MIRLDLPAVLIAEAPPPGGCGPLGALDGDAGDRLAAAADLTRERLLRGLTRCNLIDEPGAGVSDGRAWPSAEAVDAARRLHLSLAGKKLEEPLPLAGRVVLLAGRRVLRAFARAAGIPGTLPPLARLEHAGSLWVALPHPSERCRWWNDKHLRARAGEVVRHEVVRAERVTTAWCSFGADVLRTEGGDASFTYNPLTGDLRYLPSVSAHAWGGPGDTAVVVDTASRLAASGLSARAMIDDFSRPSGHRAQVLEALARNLGRVLRWGGGSTCSVLAHSVRVAHLAAAVARHLPARPDVVTVASCRRLGALHDLHEGLPGVGDHPNPPLRFLRHAVFAVDRTHSLAEALVLDLAGARSLLAGLAPAAVKVADRIAAAVERATYFEDAPAWLGPDLQRLAERLLRSTLPRTCRRWDGVSDSDPKLLLRLIEGRRTGPGDSEKTASIAWDMAWDNWCDDVLACLSREAGDWQDVLAAMVQETA